MARQKGSSYTPEQIALLEGIADDAKRNTELKAFATLSSKSYETVYHKWRRLKLQKEEALTPKKKVPTKSLPKSSAKDAPTTPVTTPRKRRGPGKKKYQIPVRQPKSGDPIVAYTLESGVESTTRTSKDAIRGVKARLKPIIEVMQPDQTIPVPKAEVYQIMKWLKSAYKKMMFSKETIKDNPNFFRVRRKF